jgi:hypothetical protein
MISSWVTESAPWRLEVPVLLGEELHRVVDAVELAAEDRQVAGGLGAAGHHQHVVVVQQPLDGNRHADLEVGAEDHAFSLHLRDAPVDQVLFHFEVGDAVAEQAANPVGLLEYGGLVAGAGQLLRAGETRRTRSHHRHPLAGAARRDLGRDPAFVPSAVDDLALDSLDGHRVVVDVERAGRLARRGANAAGELREVVGGL